MDAITQALNAYRGAVRSVAFWEDNGRRGDGMLEQAQRKEAITRRNLLRAIREGATQSH